MYIQITFRWAMAMKTLCNGAYSRWTHRFKSSPASKHMAKITENKTSMPLIPGAERQVLEDWDDQDMCYFPVSPQVILFLYKGYLNCVKKAKRVAVEILRTHGSLRADLSSGRGTGQPPLSTPRRPSKLLVRPATSRPRNRRTGTLGHDATMGTLLSPICAGACYDRIDV